MSELPRLFENAKVGDEVLCARRGWIKISAINHDSCYPIYCQHLSYTLDGKFVEGDKAPSLWPADKVPQYFLDLFPRPKKKVKKTVEVWAVILPNGSMVAFCISKEHAEKTSQFYEVVVVKMTGEHEVEE